MGAAAEAGADLETCRALGERVNRATASMGVALTSCTVPAVGRPTFALGEDEMEMGVGIHGEPGRRRVPLAGADAIAGEIVGAILEELKPAPGTPALLFVNGFGATPLMELYLLYDAAQRALAGSRVAVQRSLVGSYVTSLDMAGGSITLTAARRRAHPPVGRAGRHRRATLGLLILFLTRGAGEGDRPKGGGGGRSARSAHRTNPLHHASHGPPPPFHGGGRILYRCASSSNAVQVAGSTGMPSRLRRTASRASGSPGASTRAPGAAGWARRSSR